MKEVDKCTNEFIDDLTDRMISYRDDSYSVWRRIKTKKSDMMYFYILNQNADELIKAMSAKYKFVNRLNYHKRVTLFKLIETKVKKAFKEKVRVNDLWRKDFSIDSDVTKENIAKEYYNTLTSLIAKYSNDGLNYKIVRGKLLIVDEDNNVVYKKA